ncbi:MAG: AI-2E family transporter [Patescibacteria group bacterium]
MDQKMKLELPLSTLLKTTIFLLVLYLLFLIRDILYLLFVVGILVAAFRPVIRKWGKKIGRPMALLSLILIMFGVVAGFIYLIVPLLVEQTGQLIANIPNFLASFPVVNQYIPSASNALSAFTANVGSFSGSFISITSSVFGGLVSFLTAIILTIYFLADEKTFSNFLKSSIPLDKKDDIICILDKVSQQVGNWLRGQLILGAAIGLIVFVGLALIGVPYALTLGVIAGVLEIIPIIGPIISGILGTLLALSVSPIKALITVVFYTLVQQLENNFVAPKIMQKAVGLPPAIIIIAILIGSKLLGVLGALIAVPVAGIIFVLVKEWPSIKRIKSRNES